MGALNWGALGTRTVRTRTWGGGDTRSDNRVSEFGYFGPCWTVAVKVSREDNGFGLGQHDGEREKESECEGDREREEEKERGSKREGE